MQLIVIDLLNFKRKHGIIEKFKKRAKIIQTVACYKCVINIFNN